jgi:hypothetical protein
LKDQRQDLINEKKVTPPPRNKKKHQQKKKKKILWSSGHHMDYFTSKGVELRTGYQNKRDWYLLTIKELFDNAIDFFWEYYAGAPKGTAVITATIEIDDDKKEFFHCIIRNSNPDNKSVPFVKEDLENILEFRMRYGSKQNRHIISRGMLGDALKQIVAFPTALNEGKHWDVPVYFRANGIERRVTVHLDFATEEAKAIITESPTVTVPHTDTEIEVTLPLVDEVKYPLYFDEEEQGYYADVKEYGLTKEIIAEFCKRYMIFTTDISFKIKISDNTHKKEEDDDEPTIIILDVPALHDTSDKWLNLSNIHTYDLDEFRAVILRVHDQEDTTVYDVLKQTFPREMTQISPRNIPGLNATISELNEDPDREEKIKALYQELRKKINPAKELSLPYSHIKRKERKQHLIDRVLQINDLNFNSVSADVDRAVYEILHDEVIISNIHHDGHGFTRYPYALEILTIPLKPSHLLLAENIGVVYQSKFFVGAVNYTVSPKPNVFNGEYGRFKITKKNSSTSWYSREDINDIEEVLEEYGFSFSTAGYNLHWKLPCIIVANLISPKVSYQGHDKSAINATPFRMTIIEAVERIANNDNVRTLAGAGLSVAKGKKKDDRGQLKATSKAAEVKVPSCFKIINEVIGEDCKKVKTAKELRRILRIHKQHTQMSIWYNALPKWQAHNVTPQEMPQRKTFIPVIPDVTASYGLKREEVGIVASPWAQMYFQGKWYGVSFTDIEELSKKGVVIIFIEKQDIAAALAPYADEWGVAVVNTRGHLVEYIKDLARLAMREEGKDGGMLGWMKIAPATKESARGRIVILIDFDIHGLHIASKLPGVLCVGVDKKMLDHFNIVIKGDNVTPNVVVDYQPTQRLGPDTINEIKQDPRFSDVDFDFLEHHKVEIDAVLAHLGDQAEPIWDYIRGLIVNEWPTVNYLRAIPKRPESLEKHYPERVRKLMLYLQKLQDEAVEEEEDIIEDELYNTKGLIKVKDKVEEMDERYARRIKAFDKFSQLDAALEKFDRDNGFGISDIEVPPPDDDE